MCAVRLQWICTCLFVLKSEGKRKLPLSWWIKDCSNGITSWEQLFLHSFFCFLFCHSSSILEILTVHVSILDVIWTGPGTEARIRGFSSQCRDFLEHKMFDACTWELNNFPQDSLPCVGRTLFAICYRLSNSNGCCRAYMEGTVCLACAIKTGLYTHCFAELRVEFFSYDTVFDLDFSGTNF